MFATIKNNTNLISNHHPDNIIRNFIVRCQGKEKLEINKINKEDSAVSELYQPLKKTRKKLCYPTQLD